MQRPQKKLSAVVLHWHPQQPLRLTLESLRHVADSILVVQTHLAAEATQGPHAEGVECLRHPWQQSFADAWNQGLQAAQGEWVLCLQAGEMLSEASRDALGHFLQQQARPECGYLLWMQQPPIHPDLNPQRAAQVRLWAREQQLRFTGRVSETLMESMAAQDMELALAPLVLIHPALGDAAYRKQQALLQLELLRLELPEAPPWRIPRLLNTLGDLQLLAGQRQQARQSYQQALQLAPEGSTDRLEAYLGVVAAQEPETWDDQLAVVMRGLDEFPRDAQLLCAAGGVLQAQGRLQMAARCFQMAASAGQVNPQVWHLANVTEFALHCQGMTLALAGQMDEAITALVQACGMPGATPLMWWTMLELMLRAGQKERALQKVQTIPPHWGHDPAVLKSAIRGAHLAMQQNWLAAQAYLETAYRAGCTSPLCLQPLALFYLNTGQREQAQEVLARWMQAQPYLEHLQATVRLLQEQMPPEPTPAELQPLVQRLAAQGPGSIPAPPPMVPAGDEAEPSRPQQQRHTPAPVARRPHVPPSPPAGETPSFRGDAPAASQES